MVRDVDKSEKKSPALLRDCPSRNPSASATCHQAPLWLPQGNQMPLPPELVSGQGPTWVQSHTCPEMYKPMGNLAFSFPLGVERVRLETPAEG